MRKVPLGMRNVRARVGVVLAAGLLTSLLFAAPALADTEVGHTGTVGFHRLVDNSERAGAKCIYEERTPSSYDWEGELKHIDVRPPMMRAESGTQTVGWRFIIERAAGAGPWRISYRSSVQTAVTDTATNASFTRVAADVSVPTSNADQNPDYRYRVQLKMFWFDDDANVTGSAKHGVDWYRFIEMDMWSDDSPCRGWQAWVVN